MKGRIRLTKRQNNKKDRSLRITKSFKCKVDSPVVTLPIFQPVVVLKRHYLPVTMYSNSRVTKKKNTNLKILDNWDAPAKVKKEPKGGDVQSGEKKIAKQAEDIVVTNSNSLLKKVATKPLVDLNRPCVNKSGDEKSDDETVMFSNVKEESKNQNAVKGVFELSENFDGSYVDDVLPESPEDFDVEVEKAGSSKKMQASRNSFMDDLDDSDGEASDYNTVVDVSLKILKKMKRESDSQMNSSQSTNESESSFIKNALEDPELLSQKVKQSINYKALELLKKSIQETQRAPEKQPTRISSRKRISVVDTKYKADFQVNTKTKTKKKKKKIDKNDKSNLVLGKDFNMRSLKLLEKVLLDPSESDSDFESEIKAELNSMEKKKVTEVLEKIENRLDALMLFKESWISSDMDFDKPKVKSEAKSQAKMKSPIKMTEKKDVVKIVEPKVSLNKLQLDAIFNESQTVKPKSKNKGRKKKRPMSERSLNKKSKTFFEDVEDEAKPKVKPPLLKILKKEREKVEKPKIIPYEPLIEVKDPQQGALVGVQDRRGSKTKDWQSFSRPNILSRSYNDPKKIERRNSSDSDNKYHDTLYNLLKKEDIEQGPIITSVESLHVKRKQSFNTRNEKARKFKLRRMDIGVVDQINTEAEYENYIGENHWTNRGKRHATQNAATASYPDSDYGEDDRSHEASVEYPAYWDHTYCRRDTPNMNINFKTQTSLSDHTYLLGRKQNSETMSLEESSKDFSSITSSQDDEEKEYDMDEDEDNGRGNEGNSRRIPDVITLGEVEDEESIDPVECSEDESSEISFEPPKKNRKDTDSFRKMQRKLMRALEKLKGKSKKEKFALVKRFFAEEIFGRQSRRDGLEHNIKERERRKELQSHFRQLAAELPQLTDKPSKVLVLQGAEAFIREITRKNSVLLAELGSLKSRQLLLKRRLEILVSSMNRDKKSRY